MKTARMEKRGVALIITMGFLAIIAILAVSFAVTMRIERLVARSYADNVRSRQIAHVALARAIDAIHSSAAAGGWVWPSNVLYSATGTVSVANILSGAVTNYLPAGLLAEARGRIGGVRWANLQSGTNLIGRYAFLVVNSSGLLDINMGYDDDAAALTRSYGANLNELAYTNEILPEVKTPVNIPRARRFNIPASPAFGRIETHAEILPVLAYGYSNQQPLYPVHPTYFINFSYFPRGYWDSVDVKEPVYIGGDVSGINFGDVQTAFQSMGLSAARAKVAADNLKDYLDSDRVPQDLNSICTEPVPMLNEMVIMNRVFLDAGDGKWHNQLAFQIETWYPFVSPTGNRADYSVYLVGVRTSGGSIPGAAQNSPALPLDGGGTLQGPTDFRKSAHVFEWLSPDAVEPNMPTALHIEEIYVNGPGGKVDRIAGPITLQWRDHFHENASAGAIPVGSSWEVDDPRINWLWSRDWQNRATKSNSPANTLGNMNSIVSYSGLGKDGSPMMYVRQNGNLQVVGELGFLLYDETKPWQTIPLLGAGRLPVLDRFTTVDKPFRQGLVNANTDQHAVLATVFNNMPIERYPGEASPTRLTTTQANDLAQAVISARPATGYQNLSDIGSLTVPGSLAGLDTLQRKSLLRNSAGLLGVRQNLFTVIVLAQSAVDANRDEEIQETEVLGEAKAVALVWRDPYPVNNTHEAFVRYFRWLDE